jgi:hypothetical protein
VSIRISRRSGWVNNPRKMRISLAKKGRFRDDRMPVNVIDGRKREREAFSIETG